MPDDPLTLAQEYGLALIQRAEEALATTGRGTHSAYVWRSELNRGRRIYHSNPLHSITPFIPKEIFHVAL